MKLSYLRTALARALQSFLLILCIATSSYAAQTLSWVDWVQDLRKDAIAQGISPNLFDELFSHISEPQAKVLHFDKTQPEKRITFKQYRKTRIDPLRIRLGQQFYKKNQGLFDQIGNSFKVDPCVITAIWGIETSYGRYMGDFSVIRALATLAYDNRRGDYFRNELLIALHILNEGHITIDQFKGEWAGASGHPQFMPSSWRKYAVDYNKDGRKDIWADYTDAFASIANYLAKNGWQASQPWGILVNLPNSFPDSEVGLNKTKTVEQWQAMGVKLEQSIPADEQHLMASIIKMAGGPDMMVFNNFRVLMKYNNSVFYAGSVGYLADQICHRAV